METKIRVAKPLKGFRSVVWPAVGKQSLIALADQARDLDLRQQRDERHRQRERPDALVGLDHRPRSSEPGLGLVRVDRRPRRRIVRGLGDRVRTGARRAGPGARNCPCRTRGPDAQGCGPMVLTCSPWRRARARSSASPQRLIAAMAPETRSSSSSSSAIDWSRSRKRIFGRIEQVAPIAGQRQGDPAAVLSRMGPLDRAPLDQPLDDGRDARGRHGQLLSEGARRVGTSRDLDEHPVLSRRKVEGRQRHLDLTGEPGGGPTDRAIVQFGHQIVRLHNYRPGWRAHCPGRDPARGSPAETRLTLPLQEARGW